MATFTLYPSTTLKSHGYNMSSLIQFSTCEISDALIKLSIPHGGHVPDIFMMSPPTSGPRVCGPAYTVRMVPTSDTSAPKLPAHFVDTAPTGCMIVISAPAQAKNAVWGGLMSAGAQARSVVGVVISGRCRDLAEHHALQFPVFARGRSTLGQSPFTRPSEVNVPLLIRPLDQVGMEKDQFPPVEVVPGDWMIADEDGVVCVPRALESQVLELAMKGRVVDALCLADIKAGKGIKVSLETYRGKSKNYEDLESNKLEVNGNESTNQTLII